jgi:curved DNA-binding protein CbpA
MSRDIEEAGCPITSKIRSFAAVMKRIVAARKLLGVEKDATLQELKTIYRNFMKEWHPDKIQDDLAAKQEAEQRSTTFIEAYHLLVSVAPETHQNQREQYEETVNTSRLVDFQYKGTTLVINFADGSSYEYFAVPKSVYNGLVNSITPDRFTRRHIYHAYVYRKASKAMELA